MSRLSLLLLSLCMSTVLSGPLDPVETALASFYTAYSGQVFNSASCLTDTQQTDLITTVEAIANDFINENDFAMLWSHGYLLYEELVSVQTSCGLVDLDSHLVEFVATEGWGEFAATILQNEDILVGFGLQILQQLLQHEWSAVGTTLGYAVATVIPPEINTVVLETPVQIIPNLPGYNLFQALDNFTVGVIYGLETNPQKPVVACFAAYNKTSLFIGNSTAMLDGCLHLYIADCYYALDTLLPQLNATLQAMISPCNLELFWNQLETMTSPTGWTQLMINFSFNMQTIELTWADFIAQFGLGNYRQMGIDFGILVRYLINFRLN